MQMLLDFVNNSVYGLQAIDALWGTYCIIMIYWRLSQKTFRNERKLDEFLTQLEPAVAAGDFESATAMVEGDNRAVPQLALLAMANSDLELTRVQELVVENFQRNVITDIENKISWINNVNKTAPMLGLLGTVLGMMAAFGKLYAGGDAGVSPGVLAGDISFALITTAVGLAITLPCTIIVGDINIRLRRMDESVISGLNRFLEAFAVGQQARAAKSRR
ncbi:MAG: MotA/TolQ/ExbB proton channel family protein [Pirellulaceae bacterium]